MLRVCVLMASIFLVLPGRAFILLNPVGHQEALMGNASVGSPASSGNPLFNPAGLAFYDDPLPQFSVSGTAVNSSDSGSNLYQKHTSSLSSRTLMSEASFPLAYGIRIAPFYATPSDSTFYDYGDSTTAGTRIRAGSQIKYASALGGLSYSGMIFPNNLSWGFSVGVTWEEIESQVSTLSESAGSSNLVSLHDLKERMDIELTPSLMWKVTSNYYLGLTATLTALPILSDGTSFSQGQQSGQTQGSENFDRYTPSLDTKRGLSLGQGFIYGDWSLLFDVSYYNQNPVDDNPTWQEALGIRKHLLSRVDLLAGVNYLKSSGFSQYFATGGMLVRYTSYEFLVGAAYSRTDRSAMNSRLASDTLAFIFSSNLSYNPN